MIKKQPTIKRILVGGREMFEVFSPNGDIAATFYNEQFLRRVMEEMFDLDAFSPIPVAQADGPSQSDIDTAIKQLKVEIESPGMAKALQAEVAK